jgi:subtilase family serine protease
VGQAFRSAASEQATINLFGDQAAHPILHTATTTDTVDATISISIRNNGNHTPLSSFGVAFYEDAALSQPIGSVIVPPPGLNQPGLTGCARRDVVVDTIWEGLSAGKHKYWAEIDSDGQIVESDESDNIISGFVLVNPNQSYVPAISK